MKVEKRESGSYRIRKMIDGKMYSVTLPYKPSKKEIESIFADKMQKPSTRLDNGTFYEYAREYIDIQCNLLSPSTVRTYIGILNNLSAHFTSLQLNKLTQADVTAEINIYSVGRSPKTVRNAHAFISSVCKMFRPELELHTKLPQKQKHQKYIPTTEDVQRILDEVEGTRYYIPYRLACYGLRRGEICALEPSDLSDTNILSINKVKALNESNQWVIKPYPKTVESTREIVIDDELANMIRETGVIFNGHPNRLYDHLREILKRLDMPHFRFHDFRAYMCTELSQAGYSEADIMQIGGWASPYIMKSVYRQGRLKEDLQKKRNVADYISNITK